MENGIQLDLTASAHAGIARHSFPSSGDKHVLVDLGHVLNSAGSTFSQLYLQGQLSVNNTSLNSYSGFADYEYGWNRGLSFRIHFCGYFDTPFSSSSGGLFSYPYDSTQQASMPKPVLKPFDSTSSVTGSSSTGVGALFTWTNTSARVIESRIGISFISAEKACNFVADELPWTQTFNDTISNAKALWNGEFKLIN